MIIKNIDDFRNKMAEAQLLFEQISETEKDSEVFYLVDKLYEILYALGYPHFWDKEDYYKNFYDKQEKVKKFSDIC